MKMRVNNIFYIISSGVGLSLSYFIYMAADVNQKLSLTLEDGPYEVVGAIFFLLASILFFTAFFKSKTNKNIFFLLLGLLFLFAFLEEISWGQRIFNLSTPQSIKETNMQGEINIHNLKIFHGLTEDGTRKSGWILFLNMDRLFSIFWFTCCLLIPFLYKINSQSKKYLDQINFPIIPLSVGSFFLLNYFFARILVHFDNMPIQRLTEVKETNFAFLFFIVAIWFFKNYNNNFGLSHRVDNKL